MVSNDGKNPPPGGLPWKDDPVAAKTEWTSATAGGNSFKTHRLVEAGLSRLEFRTTPAVFGCGGCLLALGLGVISLFVAMIIFGGFEFPLLIILTVGIFFAGAGVGVFHHLSTPAVFDKRMGYFWKGRVSKDRIFEMHRMENYAKLAEIHALQILAELCRIKEHTYFSYELNIVLKDGKRINVIEHGNLKQLRSDAETLSKFLGKPVWDLTAI